MALGVSFDFTNMTHLTGFHVSPSFLPNVVFGVSCLSRTSFLAGFKLFAKKSAGKGNSSGTVQSAKMGGYQSHLSVSSFSILGFVIYSVKVQ